MKKIVILFIAIVTSGVMSAVRASADTTQTVLRPVTSVFMVGAGSAHRADTYLTPLKYEGWRTEFDYERFQAPRFNPSKWLMALNIGVGLDRTFNPARNAAMWGAEISGRWALMRRFDLSPEFTVGLGGSTSLDAGALYQSRNGNNPVAAKASWTVDLSGVAIGRFNIGHIPAVAMYRATLPFIGAFFAPEYGQLYYEVYLGDTKGLVSCARWGRYFRFDQRLTVDLRLGGTILRLGYGFDASSTKVHSVVTRSVSHTAIIGVGGEWLTLDRRHVIDPDARVIQAIY